MDAGKRSIVLWQECPGDGGLEVVLNDGYRPLGGKLTVYRGMLDLNGQNLVVQERRSYETDNDNFQPINISTLGSSRVVDSVSGPSCTSGSAPAGGGVSSGNPSNGIHVGWSRARASHRHPKTVFTTVGEKADKYTQVLPKVIAVGGAVEYGGTSRADVKDVVVLKYPETGGATVTLAGSVERLEVDGDLTVTGGSLLFGSGLAASEGQEGVVGGNHVQSGGTVNIRGASYTVSGNYV